LFDAERVFAKTRPLSFLLWQMRSIFRSGAGRLLWAVNERGLYGALCCAGNVVQPQSKFFFVWRSFYGMRIGPEKEEAEAKAVEAN